MGSDQEEECKDEVDWDGNKKLSKNV